MGELRPTSRAAAPVSAPDTLCLATLPARIQHMLAVMLQHQDVLCGYECGAIEMHFRHSSVKAKIVLHPQED
jgi:hypothetical protein